MRIQKRKVLGGILFGSVCCFLLFGTKKVVDVYTQKWEHPFVTSVLFKPKEGMDETQKELLAIKSQKPTSILNLTLMASSLKEETIKSSFTTDKAVIPKGYSVQFVGIEQSQLESLPKIGPLTQMLVRIEIETEQGLIYKDYSVLVQLNGNQAVLANNLLLDVGIVEISTGLQFDLIKSSQDDSGYSKATIMNIDNSDQERKDKEKLRKSGSFIEPNE
jgi:hypothetical protein